MTAIGGDLYWDGGLFDNTPLSPLLSLIAPEDAARTRLFVVNLFPKRAPVPQNLAAVADRMIELIFANKLERDAHIAETINRFVKLVEEMVERHPEDAALFPSASSLPSGNTRRSTASCRSPTRGKNRPTRLRISRGRR